MKRAKYTINLKRYAMSEQVKHTLHWVQGNTVNFAVPLQQETQTPQGKVVEDYYPAVDDVVTVFMCGKYLSTQIPCTVDGNVVIANDNGTLKVDVYGVEIRIKKADGTNLRSMWNTQVQIHKTNDGVLTEWDDFVAPDSQSLDAAIFFFAKGDKGDAGTTDYNELKNKPDLSIYQEREQGKGLSENDYTDEEKQLVHSAVQQESDPTVPQWAKQPNKPSYTAQEVNALPANTHIPSTTAELTNDAGFITNTVNNLVNYYLKSETYTKAEVQTLVDTIKQFTYEVVSTLPTASAQTMHKIYLTPSSDPQTQNVKDEFITIDNGQEAQTRYTWEQIGSTSISINTITTQEIDLLFA